MKNTPAVHAAGDFCKHGPVFGKLTGNTAVVRHEGLYISNERTALPMSKRILILTLTAFVCCLMLCGCIRQQETETTAAQTESTPLETTQNAAEEIPAAETEETTQPEQDASEDETTDTTPPATKPENEDGGAHREENETERT